MKLTETQHGHIMTIETFWLPDSTVSVHKLLISATAPAVANGLSKKSEISTSFHITGHNI